MVIRPNFYFLYPLLSLAMIAIVTAILITDEEGDSIVVSKSHPQVHSAHLTN